MRTRPLRERAGPRPCSLVLGLLVCGGLLLAASGCSDDVAPADAGVGDGVNADGPRADAPRADAPRADLSKIDQTIQDQTIQDQTIQDQAIQDQTAPPDLGVDAPAIKVLGNGLCSQAGALQAGPTEDGHLAAARLTPRAYPFTVTQIRYALIPPPTSGPALKCATGIKHKAVVFVHKGTPPPATPTISMTLDNPKTTDGSTIRVITRDLVPPVVLQQGEDLYVAIEMVHDSGGNVLCLRSCFPATAPKDRDYWSNAKVAPYPWVPVQSFGFVAIYSTQALGYN